MNKTSSAITLIITILLLIFIVPFLSFWLCYFVGWISKIFIGKYLVEGFALIGINLPLNKIPLLAGCLGWIASFFAHHNNSDKDS